MKVSTFAVRLWRLASILGFTAVLINTYMAFEDRLVVGFTSDGRPDLFLTRDALFYGCITLFLMNNTLVKLVSNLFPKMSVTILPVPNHLRWQQHRSQLNEIVKNWFYCLMAAVNTVMAIALWVLTHLNKQLGVTQLSGYEWLLPVSIAIISIVLVALPIRLLLKPSVEDC